MGRFGIGWVLGLAVLSVAPPTASAMRWQTAGPEAGDVHAVVVEATTGYVYAGTEGGGVFRSTDQGNTWTAVNSGLSTTIVLGLAIDPTRPGTIYAATQGGGVFRTVDGAASWTQLPLPTLGRWARGIVVDPRVPTTLYALAYSNVLKSVDDGETWQVMNMCVWNTSVRSLAFDPFDAMVMYAGTETAGVCKSVDGGQTWTSTTQATYYSGMHTIAVHPTTPNLVLAAAWWGGIYRTLDAGQTWTEVDRMASGGQIYAFAFDPVSPSTVYAGTTGLVAVMVSHDSGATWAPLAEESPALFEVSALVADSTGTTLYAGTLYDGIVKSGDRGATWQRQVHGFTATMVDALAVHPLDPQFVYAGLDTGEIVHSEDGGASWTPTGIARQWFAVTALAVDPGVPDRLYAGTVTGLSVSDDKSATWRQVLYDAVTSIVVDASSTPSVVYVLTSAGVWRSDGIGWARLAEPPYTDNVTALAVDPHDSSLLYAANENGYFYRSDDAGRTWVFVTVIEYFDVHQLFVDATLPSTIFAIGDSGVSVSVDSGQTWTPANTGFPESYDLHAFAVDPSDPPTFYAGFDDGLVLLSRDRAATWTPVGDGIPAAPVVALTLSPSGTHQVYAGTTGSGAFAFRAYCGDGIVDDGEACDDGNTVSGDCCSSTCLLEPDGAACSDGLFCNGADTCSGGSCIQHAGNPCPGQDVGPDCDDSCTEADEGSCTGPDASGIGCDDGRSCTTADTCDGAGVCNGTGPCPTSIPAATATPVATGTVVATATPMPAPTAVTAVCGVTPDIGCRKPGTLRSAVVLKHRPSNGRDLLSWKWTRGAATTTADFGDPSSTTSYALCVYDRTGGTPTLKVAAAIPVGPSWKRTGRGFKYLEKDQNPYPGGVSSLVLKAGLQGAAQISLKAGGLHLEMPLLPLAQDPAVTVQLKNERGVCWDADYTAPALRNEETEFRDRSD